MIGVKFIPQEEEKKILFLLPVLTKRKHLVLMAETEEEGGAIPSGMDRDASSLD